MRSPRLGWPVHEHHERLHAWFARHARAGWGSRAPMQAAFVCVICQPAFAGRALAVAEVVEVLRRNLAHPAHRLIPLDFGFDEALRLCTGGIFGHRKATGAWLLSATIRANVKLLSFDRGVGQLLRSDAERNADVLMLA